jgi:hypothetical protein
MHSKPSTGGDDGASEAGGVTVTPDLANSSDLQLLGEFAIVGDAKSFGRVLMVLVAPSQNGVQARIKATIFDTADVCDRV